LTLQLYLWLLVVVQFNLIPFNSEWFIPLVRVNTGHMFTIDFYMSLPHFLLLTRKI